MLESSTRVLRIRGVCARVGLSRPQIYKMEREGKFPRRINLTGRSRGWLEHEVDAWLEALASARRR